ncbi:MAG: hypothetical protein ACRDP1_00380 [Nocardioidaceae bacterium]
MTDGGTRGYLRRALSVMEHTYLVRVERRHGLPKARRQQPARGASGAAAYRDVEYEEFALVVELDGRRGHERSTERFDDMDRDLLAAVDGRHTVRLAWSHVEDAPCRTAGLISLLLRDRGWQGSPTPCGPDCSVERAA